MMLKVSLKIKVNLSKVLLGVIGVSAGISAYQYICSRKRRIASLNSSNVDCNTKNNDGINLEAWRKEQAQKEVNCNENKSVENKLDCDISENKLIQSEAAKSNSSSLS